MKETVRLIPAVLLILTAVIPAGCRSTPEPGEERPLISEKAYSEASILAQTIEFLHDNYVESDRVSYEKLLTAALRGMVAELDPYSGYEPPKEFSANETRRTGELVGLGVEIVKPQNAPLLVVNVMPDSPAAAAGLRPGDRLVEIDGKLTQKLDMERCLALTRGKEGSTVQLKVGREGMEDLLELSVKRARVVRPSVPPDAVKKLAGSIGYIRIESFNAHTPGEFRAALARLKKEGITSLILDLRNNPGGLVGAAVEIASIFLPEKSVIIRTSHRKAALSQEIRAKRGEMQETELPVLILINPFTASSSEILSGALQDQRRARLVGMKSFGKGTLLRVIPLPDGGALRFASGRYVTPSGRVIEGRGLEPDKVSKLTLKQIFTLAGQVRRYPGVIEPGKPGTIRDTQLADAVDLLTAEAKKAEEEAKEAAEAKKAEEAKKAAEAKKAEEAETPAAPAPVGRPSGSAK